MLKMPVEILIAAASVYLLAVAGNHAREKEGARLPLQLYRLAQYRGAPSARQPIQVVRSHFRRNAAFFHWLLQPRCA